MKILLYSLIIDVYLEMVAGIGNNNLQEIQESKFNLNINCFNIYKVFCLSCKTRMSRKELKL